MQSNVNVDCNYSKSTIPVETAPATCYITMARNLTTRLQMSQGLHTLHHVFWTVFTTEPTSTVIFSSRYSMSIVIIYLIKHFVGYTLLAGHNIHNFQVIFLRSFYVST